MTNSKLGKLTHYGVDLVLLSMILAGIHRNTGLVFDTSHLSSVDFRQWIAKYLAFGETCYDKFVSILRFSGYFRQKNLVVDYVEKQAGRLTRDQASNDLNSP